MTAHKRFRSETEEASRLSSTDNDPSTSSASNSELAVVKKRAHKSAPIDKILHVVGLCEQVPSHLSMGRKSVHAVSQMVDKPRPPRLCAQR